MLIIMYPMSAMGYVMPLIGLGEALHSRGHKVIFVIDPPFKGQVIKYGFEEEVLNDSGNNLETLNAGEEDANILMRSGILSGLSPLDSLKALVSKGPISNIVNKLLEYELQLKSILDEHNPDLIIIDHLVTSPTVIHSGKPWVFVYSYSSVGIEDEMTPPIRSGYPTNSDRNGWLEFQELNHQFLSSGKYNDYLISNGFPLNANNGVTTHSPFINIYYYPKELDYTDIRPLPDKWVAVDALMRKGEKAFELPVQLKAWNGKLIYFSLGSMGSINVELMKRLVNILSKSKHKFIVSKGLFGDKYELADNMWGEKSVPQTKVLPLVDLVLTHGGLNTVTESVYFGKPMIVLPLFGDQFDNAQRVQEKGFGVRLDPYLCSEEELLNSIEMLLNDNELKEKLFLASNRIQSSNRLDIAVDMIENLVN